MDRHLPGGTGWGKELILAACGAWLMVWTRTFFSNAGMDSLDYEGSMAELGSLMTQGRLKSRDKAKFYARSMAAIMGSIMFWDGIYTLVNQHFWANTPMYNAICALFGGAGIVWGTTSEDSGCDDEDGIDGPARLGTVRAALEGQRRSGDWDTLQSSAKASLYGKALFCNFCAVLCWKGVEETIEAGPDTDWTGLVFFVVGVAVLSGTERLSVNSGLDDALIQDVGIERQSPSNSAQHNRTSAGLATKTAALWGRGPLTPSFWPLDRGDGLERDGGRWGGGYDCCPRWAVTAAELTGVVFAWSGVEWYIWDGDYIADTWLRDVVYMAMGLSALLLTGTFFNLAGMVSPMAVLNQVHQHNKHEETRPLLATDEDILQSDSSLRTIDL